MFKKEFQFLKITKITFKKSNEKKEKNTLFFLAFILERIKSFQINSKSLNWCQQLSTFKFKFQTKRHFEENNDWKNVKFFFFLFFFQYKTFLITFFEWFSDHRENFINWCLDCLFFCFRKSESEFFFFCTILNVQITFAFFFFSIFLKRKFEIVFWLVVYLF